ncbi:hypothetical protein CHLRE_12g499650v5 [Chlamydomonas reinhardtii]|uniref:Uncharacterized protein n=1 Tax=Chlamydomonas reinhardtii TaxID=3055 RepID=A0A2K3D3B2_CHLRE|nr:uncharacterized protein CHLRE_12g499650v5 [Chlamydomonas reinhardtii]PNW75025.1 hypothetical protein CHLRE_12g499650v5 [Chlamydomonas reinhardtii]
MGGTGLNLNLREQLAFYGAYHNHPINQLIHFVFVPAILWSIFVWLSYIGPLSTLMGLGATAAAGGGGGDALAQWGLGGLAARLPAAAAAALQPTSPAFLVAAVYGCFYVALDLVAGASWFLCVGLPLAWSAVWFAGAVPNAWQWALGVHVFSWYMQIHPGHAVCEKRKPALLDSLAQAFALAPLFVWYELLFLLGYRPTLRHELQAQVDQLIAAHRAKKQPLVNSAEQQ